jgi:hypothetical protein
MWDLSRLYATGEVSVVAASLEGDYNGNGLVDQGDLDMVLGNWGIAAANEPAEWVNDPPSGFIDQDELDGVLGGWGNSLASVSAAAVPEPTAGILVVLLFGPLLGSAMRSRRRRMR